MAKWHYKMVDEIGGNLYLVYDADVISKLRDKKYAIANDAFDEWSYICDYYEYRKVSLDDTLVYIPDSSTAQKIDLIQAELDALELYEFDEDW